MLKLCLAILTIFTCAPFTSAQWTMQSSGVTVRLRGVSAVNRRVAWASGDKGTYARTSDGGRTWRAGQVPGAEALDFRDVDAFDADTAYLLAIGEGERSRIYKTTDGGAHWTLQFQNQRAKAFYDCMAFWTRARGIAISDPVEGRFLVVTTDDGGHTWKEQSAETMPSALVGEGAFAASGTCVAVGGKSDAWFGTGGPEGARVFRSHDGGRSWEVSKTPLATGKAAGVFSLSFWGAGAGAIVGGDYTLEKESAGNAATSDDGESWLGVVERRPAGYRSCVARVPATSATRGPLLISVGPSGSDYSTDGGRTWTQLGTEGFHALSVARGGEAAWAVGEQGRIARLDSPATLLLKRARRR